jgi:type I restriction enzyme S subunit
VPVYGTNGQTGWHDTPLFEGPGIVVGRKGMGHLGVEWTDSDFWVIDTAYALEPLGDVDLKFAYYLVRYVGLDHLKHGTSNPSLTREIFGTQYFPVPPLDQQRGIAATLGALDEKIESNRRAINLAQQLSRSIYAAWRASQTDSQEATFGEFAEVFGGATPKTTESSFWDGDIVWATPTDITALSAPYLFGTARMITEAGLASTSATLHPEGTIFMTSRATIGSFAVTHVPAATNQGFIAVRPRQPAHRWLLFEEMRARVPEMLDRANGSTFLELSRGNFKQMSLAVPDEAEVAELDSVLAPLHKKAAQLDRESSRLAKVRDTLLPELLSGRITVPEAAGAVESLV